MTDLTIRDDHRDNTDFFFTLDETANLLRISEWKARQLINTRQLHSVKIGHRRLIPRTALEDYVRLIDAQEPHAQQGRRYA
jgi:excisionase family DNA binding protein